MIELLDHDRELDSAGSPDMSTPEEDFAQTAQGIELFEYDDDTDTDNDTDNELNQTDLVDVELDEEYSSPNPLAAWEATLTTWKDPEDMPEDWDVVGLFTHPDGQKQIVVGNDAQVYWMYEGMFRLLNDRELHQFLRWNEHGDRNAFDSELEEAKQAKAEQKVVKKTWVRKQLMRKGRMMKKWAWWTLEMKSIVEEENEE